MSTDRNRAHQLLQIVEDSYIKTGNLKAAYEHYQELLQKQAFQETLPEPLNSEEYRQLQEYKKIFKTYEENINMEKKMFWYQGNEPPGLGETGACDPIGDPQPKNHDPLDEFLAGCEWKGTYFDLDDYSVEGNVYEKEGTYYLSFDGTDTGDVFDDLIRADFNGIAMGRFVPYLEKAYDFNKTAMSKLGLDENEAQDIVFLGHSLGGALASTLSAAIYLGAFRDIYNTNGEFERGEFDRSRFEGKANHSGDNIETITFNAPQMGWVFDKVSYEFNDTNIAPKIIRTVQAGIEEVDVTAVGMKDDFTFNLHGRKSELNKIGKNEMILLDENDGKLKLYFELHPKPLAANPVAWHFTRILEMALHEIDKSISPLGHEMLQLVDWSQKGHETFNACDPKNDPVPENPDKLDEIINDYENVGVYNRCEGAIIGLTFRKNGKYYMVFNDTDKQIINALPEYLNHAYIIYRQMLEKHGISGEDVVLLGYGEGGAIASSLSAALMMGASTKDIMSDDGSVISYGHYNAEFIKYSGNV